MFASSTPIVTVVKGDTLSGIAAQHGLSWQRLWEANDPPVSDPDLIYVGQSIVIPSGSAQDSPTGDVQPSQVSSSPSDVSGAYSASGWVPVPGMPDSLSQCIELRESSDNPRAVNSIPGYQGNGGGLMGDLQSTWADYDGYAQPFDAPVSVQVQFNAQLYRQFGGSPWAADHCSGT